MAKTCPHCETENPSKATHCMKCGALLVDVEELTEEEKLQKKLKAEQEENELLKAALEAALKNQGNAEQPNPAPKPKPESKPEPKPIPTPKPNTGSGKPKSVLEKLKSLPKNVKIGAMAGGAALVLLIVLLAVLLPGKEEIKTYEGKSAFDYLEQAELLASNSDYESLNSAWQYFLIADSLEDGNADVAVLVDIIYKANSLFNDKVTKGSLSEEETDTAAMFITLSRKIYDAKNDAIMAKIESDTTGSISNFSVEYYRQHFESLSNLYFKQAESAERLWTKHREDVKEEMLLKYSIQQALLYNPDNEKAKKYKEKYCK